MFIIVGLGNPGMKFITTRHNIGFVLIEALAKKHHIKIDRKKHQAFIGQGVIKGEKVILVKPQTYMNDSGRAVAEVLNFYKKTGKELILIYDDTSLVFGQLRIRKQGSAGGHNGVKSVIAHLGSQVFDRLKVGVGEKPPGWNLSDYMLSRFGTEEMKAMEMFIKESVEAIETIIDSGVDQAMNQYNKKISR